MNITKILAACERPPVYSPGTSMMWVDEHISSQLLDIHLNQHIDLASRKESTIESTLSWILSSFKGRKLDILDLGCGPGLYAEKLAALGHSVTGIDFSDSSIDYARRSARRNGLDIDYRNQDYLTLSETGKFDLVLMIFTDFGVLNPTQRNTLLGNIVNALRPGGIFIFDVLNDHYPEKETERKLELADGGFWRQEPYLAISQSFYYNNEKVTLNQHAVLDDSGGCEVYRFWTHYYSHVDLAEVLSGWFVSHSCHEKILPDSEFCPSEAVTFCVAKK